MKLSEKTIQAIDSLSFNKKVKLKLKEIFESLNEDFIPKLERGKALRIIYLMSIFSAIFFTAFEAILIRINGSSPMFFSAMSFIGMLLSIVTIGTGIYSIGLSVLDIGNVHTVSISSERILSRFVRVYPWFGITEFIGILLLVVSLHIIGYGFMSGVFTALFIARRVLRERLKHLMAERIRMYNVPKKETEPTKK